MKYTLLFALLMSFLLSCTPIAVNTLPPDPALTPTLETSLWLPPGLEILRLDYDAELSTRISDGESWSEGQRGRAFIIAHARHRRSGEHYLLVYEDIFQNNRPRQIIRFKADETP